MELPQREHDEKHCKTKSIIGHQLLEPSTEKSHSNSHNNNYFLALYLKHGYIFSKIRLTWILTNNWLWASDYHLSRLEQLERRRHENPYGMS